MSNRTYIKALLPLVTINLIFFLLEIAAVATVFSILFLMNANIQPWYLIITATAFFFIGEYIHRNTQLNEKIINKFYSCKYKLVNWLRQNVYNLVSKISLVINLFFSCWLIVLLIGFFKYQSLLSPKLDDLNVFNAVPIIGSMSAFILPLIFNIINSFREKYRSFYHIIEDLIKSLAFSSFFLVIYLLISFFLYEVGSNNTSNIIVLVYSVFLLFNLALSASKAALILNFPITLNLHKNRILNLIKKLPPVINYQDIDINEIIGKKGFKNFFQINILGIIEETKDDKYKRIMSDIYEYTNGLFEVANTAIRNSDLKQLKLILAAVTEVSKAYIPKRQLNDNKFFELISHNLDLLLDASLETKNQSFPEHILEACEQITLELIEQSQDLGNYNFSNSIPVAYFEDKINSFCAKTVNLEHSATASMAITSLRKIIYAFVSKNDILSASGTSEKILIIAAVLKALLDKGGVKHEAYLMFYIIKMSF
jgi:hypothetical protein